MNLRYVQLCLLYVALELAPKTIRKKTKCFLYSNENMDITKYCIVCAKTLNVGVVNSVKERGIQTLRAHSEKYGDNILKLLEGVTEIQVHTRCSLDYRKGSFKMQEAADSPASGRSSRASSVEGFDFIQLCIFCCKSWSKKSSAAKYVVSSDLLKEKLLQIAQERNDEQGAAIISVINSTPSLVEAKARYHEECFDLVAIDCCIRNKSACKRNQLIRSMVKNTMLVQPVLESLSVLFVLFLS